MNKRGGIWISAVLYIALGIILISMILAAGLPTIQKMKDRYTIRQTKDLMLILDENIRNVNHEGPGSQRVVKLKIGRGLLEIDNEDETIIWSLNTKVPASEPSSEDDPISAFEGNLVIQTRKTSVEKQYNVNLILNYLDEVNIELGDNTQSTLSGTFRLSILNMGHGDTDTENEIKITFI